MTVWVQMQLGVKRVMEITRRCWSPTEGPLSFQPNNQNPLCVRKLPKVKKEPNKRTRRNICTHIKPKIAPVPEK